MRPTATSPLNPVKDPKTNSNYDHMTIDEGRQKDFFFLDILLDIINDFLFFLFFLKIDVG